MTSSRSVVLGRIRAALGEEARTPPIPREYRRSGINSQAGIVDLFTDRVTDYGATVTLTDRSSIPTAIARALSTAQKVVIPDGLDHAWLPTSPANETDEGFTHAELDTFDAVVTAAAVGIAETGTIVLDGSPDQGRRAITLIPDHHICIIEASAIVETVPEALTLLGPDRPQTWISGPSATSDIELSRVEGVHGPRKLGIVIVDGTGSPQSSSVTG
ncbi:MAG: LutC/YkgG family protein [Acidimicrobiia bacterium]